MQTHSAKHSAKLRHSRRARFWVGVVCTGIFGVLTLMAYVGLDQTFAPLHEVVAAPPPKFDAMSNGTGHLVWVDSDGCTVSKFDNLNGQLGAQQMMPCSQFKNMSNRHKQSPLNRFKKFNSGFQK
ncbi:MAG: hypothetical protein WCA36_12735 [Pseudolabrys sp.]|jgi:gamma-glutamyltranspeptidase